MAAPLRNAQSTEGTTMETPRRPGEPPFDLSKEVGKGFLIGSVIGPPVIIATGGIQALLTEAPRVSGFSAVWWATFSAIKHARRKEDTLVLTNALALAGAQGITSLPKGIPAAGRSALIAGAAGVVLFGGLKMLLGDQHPQNRCSRARPLLAQHGQDLPGAEVSSA
jgi:hypothetical protein